MKDPIENLSHAISACNELHWKLGEPEPYLLTAAKEARDRAEDIVTAYKSLYDLYLQIINGEVSLEKARQIHAEALIQILATLSEKKN